MAAAASGLLKMINKQYVEDSFYKKESQMKNLKSTMKSIPKTNSVGWCKKKNDSTSPAMDRNSTSVGRLVKDGLVYSQSFVIRSFEIGFDAKLSITSLINYLQETALNHARTVGILADGEDLGITKQMYARDLIWVVSSLQLIVDQYPSWLDVVEIETWMYPWGQNGLGRDWIIRHTTSGHSIAQATSVCVLMNKETRKLSKFTNEVRQELGPHMILECTTILDKDTLKLPQLDIHSADFARTGLRPGWSDLDANQHVNNAKYVDWILESVPGSLIEHHELCGLKLKYRRECKMESELQSVTKAAVKNADEKEQNESVELEHLLCLDNGLEIVGGRTLWKPRYIPL